MSTIQTYTGKMFNLLEPTSMMIDIEDIAHSLSQQVRFSGHLKKFYSIAQHSVLVSSMLPDRLKLTGLLHDAAEAYIGDIASPLKQLLPEYKKIEKNIELAIADTYQLQYPFPDIIKIADTTLLLSEAEQLFLTHPYWINYPHWSGYMRTARTILPWTPEEARDRFMKEFILWRGD